MTRPKSKAEAEAVRVLLEATEPEWRFPRRVIRWADAEVLFIDGDRFFGEGNVELFASVMKADDAECIAVCNLEERRDGQGVWESTLFVRRDSVESDVAAVLWTARESGWSSWAECQSDFAMSSNTGRWVIVMDKELEIAVMAVRSDGDAERFRAVIPGLPIEEALTDPPSFGMVPAEQMGGKWGLLPEWAAQLRRNYRRV